MEKKRFSLTTVLMTLLALVPVAAYGAGIPKVTVDLLREKIHHAGVAVLMDVVFTNNSNKEISIALDANPFEGNRNATADGESYSLVGAGEYNFTVPAGESVKRTLYVDNFPYNVRKFDSLKIKGRSSATTQSNPYGEFVYTIQNVDIPSFPNSNRRSCYFLDTEFDMTVDKIIPDEKDLVIVYSLTNNGKRDKELMNSRNGKATDEDGDEYAVQDPNQYSSTEIASGESVRGKVIVKGGAKRNFKKVRIMYDISERGGDSLSYPVMLQLDNISPE